MRKDAMTPSTSMMFTVPSPFKQHEPVSMNSAHSDGKEFPLLAIPACDLRIVGIASQYAVWVTDIRPNCQAP